MTAAYFAHFPLLVVTEPCDALGGVFIPLPHEHFKTLDRDWAAKAYFERTRVVVWKKSVSLHAYPLFDTDKLLSDRPNATPEELKNELIESILKRENLLKPIWNSCQADVRLLYAGILVQTLEPYPDPLCSASYLKHEEDISRRFGIRERTSLINGVMGPEIPKGIISSVGALASAWKTAGLTWEDQAFSLLRALAFVFTHDIPIHLSALPIVVALEGLLLPIKTRGIANAITRAARDLLGPTAPADLNSLISDIYDWRSDIIHGRFLTPTDWTDHFNSLSEFSRLISKTLLERIIIRGLRGNDISGALAR